MFRLVCCLFLLFVVYVRFDYVMHAFVMHAINTRQLMYLLTYNMNFANPDKTRMWADAKRDDRRLPNICGALCESSIIPFLL